MFNLKSTVFFVFVSLLFSGKIIFASNNSSVNKEQAKEWMAVQPVLFLENKGQMVDMNGKSLPSVLFKAQAIGLDMYITEKGLTYVFLKSEDDKESRKRSLEAKTDEENIKTEWERIDMTLGGASIKKENILKEDRSENFFQYFLGHCPEGISDVHTYKKITIKEVYPGIDWVLYNSGNKGFKYDFVVHPGADYKQIELIYSSLNQLQIGNKGEIKIETELGTLTENAPLTYQTDKEISSGFINIFNKKNSNEGYEARIKFEVENYNSGQTFIIDPQLVWATTFGGYDLTGPKSIATDASGNVFVSGYNNWTNFPVMDPGGGAYFQGTDIGFRDVFITKFSNSGNLLWSTYYGGSIDDVGYSICTDGVGNIFLTGYTRSSDFPVMDPGGSAYFLAQPASANDFAFILKFSNNGNRLWATCYWAEKGYSICTDPYDNVFVTGQATYSSFSLQNPGGGAYFQGTMGGGSDAFILKFDNSGVKLWATYYGGSMGENMYAGSICTDNWGNVFVTGDTGNNLPVLNPGGGVFFQGANAGNTDAFILKFTNSGVRLWATHYGGSGWDVGVTICAGPSGDVFIRGSTGSYDLPVFDPGGNAYFQGGGGGQEDAFILKFSNSGVLLWATYFGGSDIEHYMSFDDIAVDDCNNLYVSLVTSSYDMPVHAPCDGTYYDDTYNDGVSDLFIAKFNNSCSYLWGTYFGGDREDFREALTLDKSGNLFITGEWTGGSSDLTNLYPIVNPGGGAYSGAYVGSDNGYIAKFVSTVFTLGTAVVSPAICGCTGSATINASGGCSSYSFKWYDNSWVQVGSTQTINNLCSGNYTVIVTDGENCRFDSANVTINNSGIAATLNGNNSICESDSTILTAGGGTAFLWNTGLTTSSITVSPPSTTTYSVIVHNGTCIDTAYITINVVLVPVANVSGPDTVCQGQDTKLIASGGSTYSWSTGDQTSQITVKPLTNTTYSVIVSNGSCSDTASISLIANPLPIPNAGADVTINDNAYTQLLATGGGTYSWYPPIGLSCINCQDPLANPKFTTTYCVVVTDSNGCHNEDCVTVTYPLLFPNVFTPNGDGANDVFIIQGLQPDIASIKIYNRWGNIVYQSAGYKNDWEGKGVSSGVYFYVLKYPLNNETFNGFIQVVSNE